MLHWISLLKLRKGEFLHKSEMDMFRVGICLSTELIDVFTQCYWCQRKAEYGREVLNAMLRQTLGKNYPLTPQFWISTSGSFPFLSVLG